MRIVGKIIEAHSLKGDLYVFIFSGDVSWAPKMKKIELRDSPEAQSGTAFQVLRSKPHKKGLILTLGFKDRTEAEKWEKKFLFVPDELFVSEEGEEPYLVEFEGYSIFNGETDLGPIIGFRDNGAQDLFVVNFQGVEHEIPFVEEFIVEIDDDKKQIHMQLPEGLLELNS
jgi:16S rRNA processing protein RimM